jgi:hypothetical protein
MGCLVAAEMVGAGPGVAAGRALDPDSLQDRDQLRAVTPLAGCDQQCQRPAASFSGEVDFAGQTAPGASESFVGAVLPRRRPFFGIRGFLRGAPAACWWARHDVESTLTMLQSTRP